MPKLAAVVDSLDVVPEAFREAYTADGSGKFVLDTDVDAHPAVAGLKKKSAEKIGEAKKLEQQLAALKAGIGDHTPEELAEILAAHRSSEEDRAKKAGEFDKLLAKAIEKTKAEYAPAVQERDELRSKYDALEFKTVVGEAALKAGVDPEKLATVLRAVRDDRIRRGKSGLEVLDAVGETSTKTVEEFFASDFKKEAPYFYLGTDARGSGAGADTGRKIGAGVISARDPAAFLANLDNIESGKVKVA